MLFPVSIAAKHNVLERRFLTKNDGEVALTDRLDWFAGKPRSNRKIAYSCTSAVAEAPPVAPSGPVFTVRQRGCLDDGGSPTEKVFEFSLSGHSSGTCPNAWTRFLLFVCPGQEF